MPGKLLCWYISAIAAIAVVASCGNQASSPVQAPPQGTYPEKAEMIVHTDRPMQLETPLRIFRQDITPNEYFFVRWHLADILTRIDIDTFRLRVTGAVNEPLTLSLTDLKTKFPADSVIALAICSGNSRSTFDPKVAGIPWQNGSMGNAKWKGVRVKDILAMAGVKNGAVDVSFLGMDKGTMPSIPPYAKSLSIDHAIDGEVLIAYEMNGQPLPMLNGYPLKLVVPGWYATYWVGALGAINVLTDSFDGFWMKKAYRVTTDPNMNESPEKLSTTTSPITAIKLHSIFVVPEPGQQVAVNKPCMVEGLAFNDGTDIQKVELSVDSGKTWVTTQLQPTLGKYSWRRWKYNWTPNAKGTHHLCVRATDINSHTQPEQQWNRSGYARSFIEHLAITVN